MKKDWSSLYYNIYANKILVFGALNYLIIGLTGFNFIRLADKVHPLITILIYLIIGMAGLYQLTRRDFYLSFLGKSVYPCGSLLEKKPENATIKKTIKTKPNINVIYWAAEYNDKIFKDPYIAYDTYANTGVVKSDDLGNAILEVREPQGYKVPYKSKTLKPHIHYRECFYEGMLEPIKTLYL